VLTNALATVVPQLAALILLTPVEYATFGLVFIVVGLTFSAQLSLVIDPWLRDGGPEDAPPVGPLMWSAVVLSTVAAVIPFALGYVGVGGAVLAALGMVACQVRNGIRLIHVAGSQWRSATISDLVFLAAFALVLPLTWRWHLWTTAWVPLVVGSLVAVLPWLRHLLTQWRGTAEWWHTRRRTITGLWVESSLLDLGVAIPPLALAQLMMPAQFAIVRAASSALLPVRLVLNPLRSSIAMLDPALARSGRFVGGSFVVGAMAGIAIWAALKAGSLLAVAEDSVLPEVAHYASLIAVMATLQFMSNCVYIVARKHAPPKNLLVARAADTVIQVIAVLGGYAVAGLGGALMGYVCLSATSYIIWLIVTSRSLAQPSRA
jgi:hypothetical protein